MLKPSPERKRVYSEPRGKSVYIWNIEGTKIWRACNGPLVPPEDAYQRQYVVPRANFDAASRKANELVKSYQGKTQSEVDLPESLLS